MIETVHAPSVRFGFQFFVSRWQFLFSFQRVIVEKLQGGGLCY